MSLLWRHGVKVGTGHRDPRPRTISKVGKVLKVGLQDSLKSLKVRSSHLSLMNIFFSEHFFFFFYLFDFLSFINNIQKRSTVNGNQQSTLKIKKVYMTTKKLSEETREEIVNPNPIEVIALLDHHRLAILFKVYL